MSIGWTFESEDARRAHDRRRDFIRHLAIHASSESDLAAAEIIYGELIGNVVRHANGRVRVVLEWRVPYAVLRVRDYGRGFVHNFELPSTTSESGRGLYIVRTLARKLEVKRHPVGSEIHVTLPVRKAA